MKHTELLKFNACIDGLNFAEQFETLKEAWNACENPKWMLWYAQRKGINRTDLVRINIFLAEYVLSIFEEKYPDDKRPRKAIESAKAYLVKPSDINRSNVSETVSGAYAAAAYAASNSAHAASDAASAASYAATYAASTTYATYATSATYAASNSDRLKLNFKHDCCDFIRSIFIPNFEV